jgi:hypothetical protein
MSNANNENISQDMRYVVYSTAGGVALEIDEVPIGVEWYEGAMESYYATFDTREEALEYVQSFFGDRNKTDDNE